MSDDMEAKTGDEWTRPTDEEFARCERQARAVANSFWSTLTNEQVDELTDYDPDEPDDDRTRWDRLLSHVYTSILGAFHWVPALITRAPNDPENAGGGFGGCSIAADLKVPSCPPKQLAQRWAIDRALANRYADDTLPPEWDHHEPLDEGELDALLGWVYRRMECAAMPGEFAQHAATSGLHGEREVLAYAVGLDLDGAFKPGTGGWHRRALELCNAAGWPS